MGDNITDLSKDCDVPPVPPKTYQWEDIKKQRLEGRYPWTHLYKAPFDNENWDKLKEHEYEIVVPMDSIQKTPPPLVKITVDKERSNEIKDETNVTRLDTNRLRVPGNNDDDDDDDDKYENGDDNSSSSDDDDLSEEITAAELQHRLEETYFHGGRCNKDEYEHEYELTETTHSDTPSTAGSKPQTPPTPSLHANKVDRIRQKFKAFRDQLAGECSPRPAKRKPPQKSASLPKKNKFNFRKRTATIAKFPDRSENSAAGGESSPSAPPTPSSTSSRASRFSFPVLSTFSRSRSSSSHECKQPCNMETESKKQFDFGFSTYPRLWSRKNRKEGGGHPRQSRSPSPSKKSTSPGSPSRKSPFSRRWFLKKDSPKVEKVEKDTNDAKVDRAKIVHETIFVSLHDDTTKKEQLIRTGAMPPVNPHPAHDEPATKPNIDDKNFIFISLHEERFPEKLPEQQEQQLTEEELDIERELKTAQTTRQFQHMLWKLENDRKLRARRAAVAAAATADDDKPEPVVITELANGDCADDEDRGDTITVETPCEEDFGRRVSGENVSPDRFKFESRMTSTLEGEDGFFHRRVIISDSFNTPARPAIPQSLDSERTNDDNCESCPPAKTPRKKSRKLYSSKESKESLTAFEDSIFKHVVQLDVQSAPTAVEKTYIAESLEQISSRVENNEAEHTAKRFAEYERALENARSYSSFEIESSYSLQNTLARLETPVPPARPFRKGTLSRIKHERNVQPADKENGHQATGGNADGANFNTFPIVRGPDKPRRKLRKRRTYSNSTNNTDVANALEDDNAIKTNIVNSKQLSVSFLPLSSNVVGEPIIEYNLRETSSMIHLNIKDPPLPPKRRKSHQNRDNVDLKFNSLPAHHAYSSKTSSIVSENINNLELNIETEIEYADDTNSTIPNSSTPPKRPCRKHFAGPSMPDDDYTSREIESLPSELSAKEEVDFCDSDSKDLHGGYAIIGRPISHSAGDSSACDKTMATRRRKSRRFSDFFTLPRIRVPVNYVQPVCQTLNRRRLPSPTRPPRRSRKLVLHQESAYVNDIDPLCESENIFDGIEKLNFALATLDNDDDDEEGEEELDTKDLRAEDVLEKMKSRPLPPPPRPTRKQKEKRIVSDHYSQCSKKKSTHTNNLGLKTDDKILNVTTATESAVIVESKNPRTNECSNSSTRFESITVTENNRGRSTMNREYTIETSSATPNRIDVLLSRCTETPSPTDCITQPAIPSSSSIMTDCESSPPQIVSQVRDNFQPFCTAVAPSLDVINASRINVSELNVTKLNVDEIESNRLSTSNVDCSMMEITNVRTGTRDFLINSIDFPPQFYSENPSQAALETIDKSLNSCDDSATEIESSSRCLRSRFSSMVPEVGSDDEKNTAKVVRPSRRRQSLKKEPVSSPPAATQPSDTDGRRPTLSELMLQILQICHSSVGQAIHLLLEQFIPEDRDKRNEVQAAIWVVTIIVAGCLMLGLQTNEKVVHHHHWDFHFPPPH